MWSYKIVCVRLASEICTLKPYRQKPVNIVIYVCPKNILREDLKGANSPTNNSHDVNVVHTALYRK